jgi:thiamine kinase-like enzyme
MSTVQKFVSLLRNKLRFPNRGKPMSGLPKELNQKLVKSVVEKRWGESVQFLRHTHLSGWKDSCAYRVFIATSAGHERTMIYKRASYRQDEIPALIGLPIKPGPPEFCLYSSNHEELSEFLPQVYFVEELTKGACFQYLLEDLSENYKKSYQSNDILNAASKLALLHDDLAQVSIKRDNDCLLYFDRDFTIALLKYAKQAFEIYYRKSDIEMTGEITKHWEQIEEILYINWSNNNDSDIRIHGDFNCANILFNTNKASDIKVIDWEWMGVGHAYDDLVSLLKGADEELEHQAIFNYEKARGLFENKSITEMLLPYNQRKLQRSIFDAAFFIRQGIQRSNKEKEYLDGFIERAMKRGVHALTVLQKES